VLRLRRAPPLVADDRAVVGNRVGAGWREEACVTEYLPRRDGVGSPISGYLSRLHSQCRELRAGEVATYIPALAKADAEWFGVSIATMDGRVYEIGDTRQPFTIQSISKPFVYGLALEDRGRDAVLQKIGVEPSGEAFNAISLRQGSGCPFNPMINAGAIAATSLIAGHSAEDKLHRLLSVLSLYAGRALALDHEVYESERETGHRNRAIAHLLRNFEVVSDPDPALDLYFRQCSVAVDCRDLSRMAATLANDGINPATGERAVGADFVESVLSVMTTSGMYDFAGEWVYWVGMPAKSGVSGGILAVLPGQLGVAVFSPPLDARGNSVRGVQVCKQLSRDFNLHFLRVPRSARAAVRAEYSLAGVRSKRLRTEAQTQVLDELGSRARVYELQGDIAFSAAETLVHRIVDASHEIDFAIISLKQVTRIEGFVAGIFLDLLVNLGVCGKRLLFVGAEAHTKLLRRLEERLIAENQPSRLLVFADLDPALEWCEERLIGLRSPPSLAEPVPLERHDLCRGLSAEALVLLERLVVHRRFAAGALIIRKGDPAEEIYLLVSGRVSVTISLPTGQQKRLSTVSPGMVFGELAVLDQTTRNANVRADTDVGCYTLGVDAFRRLGETHPAVKITLLENLLRNASQIVSRLNREVAALSQ
jgi:glutaminase